MHHDREANIPLQQATSNKSISMKQEKLNNAGSSHT